MSPSFNKAIIRRFNQGVIEQGDRRMFDELVSQRFVNHSAPAGAPADRESLWHTFQNVLRPAFGPLTVVIHDQVAEGDLVTTRKTVSGVHVGVLAGISATFRQVDIEVIDIVRVVDGQYTDHWGVNTLPSVLDSLRKTG